MTISNIPAAVAPIPVTLVTGFLGAGKTTLLEHILKANTGLRIAIIENEFGDVGVDGSMITAPRDVIFELNDGCVCCTVRDDLREVLEEIITRRSEFDHVLIETTGLAEPGPVLRLFDHPAIRESLTFNGVVTVVDAHHLEQSLSEVTACAEQITYADLIILNKTDNLAASTIESKEAHVRQINPLATLLRAERAQVDARTILELDGRRSGSNVQAEHAPGGHDHHHHDETIRPAVVETQGNVDIDAVDLWLGHLARSRDPLLLRMKGVLAVEGSERSFIFNGVRSSVDVHPGRPWGSEPRYSRIVFIGRGLDTRMLQEQFEACIQR